MSELSGQPLHVGLTRIAPSPTGELHLGHVAHLLYVVGVARHLGLRLLLRMEDHDRQRCHPAYEAAIAHDLYWLEVPEHEGFTGAHPDAYRQSDTPQVYLAALEHLARQGLLYGCDCSRKDIAARSGPHPPGQELAYDGHCRNRGLPPGPGYGWRVKLPAQTVAFTDARLGPQRQSIGGGNDTLLRDRLGQFTYQLCVVVDDGRQGITHLIRGEDVLPSTGRQLLLRELLGYPDAVTVYHHPLLTAADGTKLSKGTGAPPIRHLREAGYSPGAVRAQAARHVGWAGIGPELDWLAVTPFVAW